MIENKGHETDNVDILVDLIIKYESSSASPLENNRHLDKLEVIEMFEKNLNNSLSDEDLIDFEKLTDGFFLFSEQEKAFLYQYATKHLNVRYNK